MLSKFALIMTEISCKIEKKEVDSMDYEMTANQLSALTEGVPYETANLANASALSISQPSMAQISSPI